MRKFIKQINSDNETTIGWKEYYKSIIDKKRDIDELCLKCPYAHCNYNEQCPAIKNKAFNKYKKLNNYVYINLKQYGNTVIGEFTYATLGEKAIIKDIKSNGFKDVRIDIKPSGTIIIKAAYVVIE